MNTWPRGKYNGKLIEGFKISFAVHIFDWYAKPIMRLNHGEPYFIWLCFTFRCYVGYFSNPSAEGNKKGERSWKSEN